MGIDTAHLHLMLNHAPVIGAPLVLLLLTVGLWRGSRDLVTVSLVLVLGLAVTAALVYFTGEPAEEAVEHAPWFREALVETHEEHALVSLVASLVTGALAAASLVFRRRGGETRWLPRAVWAALAVSTLLFAWTAWSGGRIRHDELRSTAIQATPFDRNPSRD